MEAALVQAEEQRDKARSVAVEFEQWLDQALTALGVETVFDIPKVEKHQ